MLELNLQLFAHKKGGGSTSNGRDSQAKRLGAKASDGELVAAVQSFSVNVVHISIQVLTLAVVATILSSLKSKELLNSK